MKFKSIFQNLKNAIFIFLKKINFLNYTFHTRIIWVNGFYLNISYLFIVIT